MSMLGNYAPFDMIVRLAMCDDHHGDMVAGEWPGVDLDCIIRGSHIQGNEKAQTPPSPYRTPPILTIHSLLRFIIRRNGKK